TAVSALPAWPQDSALLSLCPDRRRDGAQLRHFELQRHSVFRVQRRCARSAGPAAFGNAADIEFHGAAGSRRSYTSAKERRKEGSAESARECKGCSDQGARAGTSSCIHSASASRFRQITDNTSSPSYGGKSLDADDRLGIVKQESRKRGRHSVSFADDLLVGRGSDSLPDHSHSGCPVFCLHCGDAHGTAASGPERFSF